MNRYSHPVFASASNIPDAQMVWRYFDLSKFISLLNEGGLYFCRADLLGDPYEGSFPSTALEDVSELKKQLDHRKVDEHVQYAERFRKRMKEVTFINCWHMGVYESMAMWHGYGSGRFGIAVCSTFKQLRALVNAPKNMHVCGSEIYFAKVKYDLQSHKGRFTHSNNAFTPFVHKSNWYAHEKELRAMFSTASNTDIKGHIVSVNLKRLINKIVVSPLADVLITNVVEKLCRKYGYRFKVELSTTAAQPVFVSSLKELIR